VAGAGVGGTVEDDRAVRADRVDGRPQRGSSHTVKHDVKGRRLELVAGDDVLGAHVDELGRAGRTVHLRRDAAAGAGGELNGKVSDPAGGSQH
jgi:hypothetical protein